MHDDILQALFSGGTIIYCGPPSHQSETLHADQFHRPPDIHVLEVSDDFRNNTENRGKTTLHVCEAATGEVESTLEAMRKKCIDVFEFLLPTIKAYFDSTNSYQGIVDRIAAPSAYYRAINPTRGIARVYLVAFLGKKDEALKELEKMSFADERTRERHLENLRNL